MRRRGSLHRPEPVTVDIYRDSESPIDSVLRSLAAHGCRCSVRVFARPISRHDPEYADFVASGSEDGLHVETIHQDGCPAVDG